MLQVAAMQFAPIPPHDAHILIRKSWVPDHNSECLLAAHLKMSVICITAIHYGV